MGIIDIVEGSFPVQAAVIMSKTRATKNTTLIVKAHGKERLVYSLRSAVKSLETVIDHKKKPTIKIVLSDGSLIIGKADHKSIEEIKIAQALGPDAEPAVTTIQSIRDKRRLKKAVAADNSVFKHPVKALLLIIFIPVLFGGLIKGGSDGPSHSTAPVMPLRSAAPVPVKKVEMRADQHDANVMAAVLCNQRVKDSLKAPRTAKFPWVQEASFNGRTAVMSSYVDAENGFGAMIRTRYICTVEYRGGKPMEPGNWIIKSLDLAQ